MAISKEYVTVYIKLLRTKNRHYKYSGEDNTLIIKHLFWQITNNNPNHSNINPVIGDLYA